MAINTDFLNVQTSYASLKTYSKQVAAVGVYINGLSGLFIYDSTLADEDGGTTILSDVLSGGWRRMIDGTTFIPEWWEIGGYIDDNEVDNTIANAGDQLIAAMNAGGDGATILLQKDATYIYDRQLPLYSGVTIKGNNSTLQRISSPVGTLSANFVGGTSTITLTSTTGFRKGQRITVVDTSLTNGGYGYGESWNDTDSIEGQRITDITGNVVTFSGAPATSITSANAEVYVASQTLVTVASPIDNFKIEGVIFDGNSANNPIRDWRSCNTYFESDNDISFPEFINCKFINIPSENIIQGGVKLIGCSYQDIQGSFIHISNGGASFKRPVTIIGCYGTNCNIGTDAIMQHSEGLITFSAAPLNFTMSNCSFDTGAEAIFGGPGADTPNMRISDCTFEDFNSITMYTTSVSATPFPDTMVRNAVFDSNTFINCGDFNITNADTPEGGSTNKLTFTGNTLINSRFAAVGITQSVILNNKFMWDSDSYTFSGFSAELATGFPAWIYAADWDQVIFSNNIINGPRTLETEITTAFIYDFEFRGNSDGRFRNSAASTQTEFYYPQNIIISNNNIAWFKRSICFSETFAGDIALGEFVGWKISNNQIQTTDDATVTEIIGIQAMPGMMIDSNQIYVNADANSSTWGIGCIGISDNLGQEDYLRGPVVKHNYIPGAFSNASSIQVGSNPASVLSGYNCVVKYNTLHTAVSGFADNISTTPATRNSIVEDNLIVDSASLAHFTSPLATRPGSWAQDTSFYA